MLFHPKLQRVHIKNVVFTDSKYAICLVVRFKLMKYGGKRGENEKQDKCATFILVLLSAGEALLQVSVFKQPADFY